MGKGSENTFASESNSAQPGETLVTTTTTSKTLFKWEEVRKHDKRNDCWIVVNGNVYNMTTFQNRHPGGAKVIQFYAGQDATDVFNAFHKEFDKVEKYSRLYHIGIIDPTERLDNEQSREAIVRKDFANVRKIAIEKNLFAPSYTFYVLHGLQIILSHIIGYYILLKYGYSFVPFMAALMFHLIAQGQTNWTQHDYGHSSFSKTTQMNKFIHLLFIGLIKGASPSWWTHMHNMHHAKPNVLDKDPDVRIEPIFVLGNVRPRKVAEKNVKYNKNFLYPYTIQHYLFPAAAAALFPFFFQFTTFKFVIQKKKYIDLAFMIPFFVIHFILTYLAFNSVVKCFFYLLLIRLIESSWFTWVAQCNHVVMDIHEDAYEDTWFDLQLKATCNIEKSFFNDWFTGHLNFQIEHHLFPTMPRHNLYKIQPYVQEMCKKHNITYVVKPLGRAFLDILTSLKKYGELWKEAYDEIKNGM